MVSRSVVTSALTPQEIADHFSDYFENLAMSSPSSTLIKVQSTIPDLEILSFLTCKNILDTEVEIEEIDGALKTLKLGKSGGIDSLNLEHIYFGGETLKL